MNHLLPLGLIGALVSFVGAAEPQSQAHAHNDYEHERPLLDALSHGFCSVEADIFEVNGELLVAHHRKDIKPFRTLQKLYLEPLKKRIQANGGRVFRDGPRFTLLIDFKTAAEPTYNVLRNVLADYRELFVTQAGGKRQPGPVSVVISGNRPFELIQNDKERLCGIDGRLKDLDSKMSSSLMPLISDNWRSHFKWNGDGAIPAGERDKLRMSVNKAHAAGRRVRFWATPENENLWRELVEAGVDHVNTDQLARLETFLKERQARRHREPLNR